MRMDAKYWVSIVVAGIGAFFAALAWQWLGALWAVMAALWCYTAGQNAAKLQGLEQVAMALKRQVSEATKQQ